MSEPTSKQETRATMHDWRYHRFGVQGGVPFDERSTSLGVDTTYVNKSLGVKLPNWRSIIAHGGDATTTFSYQYQTSEDHIGVVWFKNESISFLTPSLIDVNQAVATGIFPMVTSGYTSTVPSSVQDEVFNRCVRFFVQRCDSARSSFESGQDFGEAREALESIIHPLSSLRRHVLGYFSKVEKLRKYSRNVPTLRKALTDTYLEWTFGYKPLASDIGDAIVGFQNRSQHYDAVSVSSSATGTCNSSSTSDINYYADSWIYATCTIQKKTEYSMRYRGSIRTGAVNGTIGVDQLLQLDLPHFLPTIYDLLPYSFIVDYFLNVGDIIKALSFRFADLRWANYSVRQTDFVSLTPNAYYLTNLVGLKEIRTHNGGFYGGNRVVRTVVGGRGVLSQSMLMPRVHFQLPISSKPWINMAAILLSKQKSTQRMLAPSGP